MILEAPIQALNANSLTATTTVPVKFRRVVQGVEPAILADIYKEETNIVIWQRELSVELQASVKDFLALNHEFQATIAVTPQDAFSNICKSLGIHGYAKLSENIAELVDMFCCLFDLKRAGLRLTVLDHAMCPRFHVDKVPCRLVTTYQGVATVSDQ